MNADLPVVLVVDDRANMLRMMKNVLGHDAHVVVAETGGHAIEILRERPVSVVVCDLKMPDMDGLEVLRESKRLRPGAEFILMTAHGSVATAVDAMRLGAYDYLMKPFDPAAMRAVVLRALSQAATTSSRSPQFVESPSEHYLPGLIGPSRTMRELGRLVRRIAVSDATVLVVGETGSGKERIARTIHALSARSAQRFVAANVATIPPERLESKLFGYSRGAFASATRDRPGLFEDAHKGALFIDEVGDLRPSLQARLAWTIDARAVRRLGESRERVVDVRLIAATHRDLASMVKSGGFREDLWYRLNVAVVRVPPLRERREDVEALAVHFLREVAASRPEREVSGFTGRALGALQAYDWPGNVRQLRAAVESAAAVGEGAHIDLEDLPAEIAREAGSGMPSDLSSLSWQGAIDLARDEAARRYLTAVLRRHQGRVDAAAAHAGVARESFYRLLRKYRIRVDVGCGGDDGGTSG